MLVALTLPYALYYVADPMNGVEHRVFLMDEGEEAKCLETVEELCRDFARWGLTRGDVVVAVGACGCSGGIFGEGTYASVGGVDRVLPVDVYVPGCPPRPQAILHGLLVAMDVREGKL